MKEIKFRTLDKLTKEHLKDCPNCGHLLSEHRYDVTLKAPCWHCHAGTHERTWCQCRIFIDSKLEKEIGLDKKRLGLKEQREPTESERRAVSLGFDAGLEQARKEVKNRPAANKNARQLLAMRLKKSFGAYYTGMVEVNAEMLLDFCEEAYGLGYEDKENEIKKRLSFSKETRK